MKKEYLNRVKTAAAILLAIAAGISYCFYGGHSKTVRLTDSAADTVESDAYADAAAENTEADAKTADKNTESIAAAAESEEGAAAVSAETESAAVCYVYVCGEVRNPGVYELEEESRIYAAIEAAGGFTEQAAETALNLAAPVADGMQITVYSEAELLQAEEADRSETEGSGKDTAGANAGDTAGSGVRTNAGSGVKSAFSETGEGAADENETSGTLVNINTATKEELMTLTGIGESKAEKILQYREGNGRFETIEDIMKVSGIKEAGFQKIKDRITV